MRRYQRVENTKVDVIIEVQNIKPTRKDDFLMGKPIITKKCSVEGCAKKHLAKGWCTLHYHRNLYTGHVGNAGYKYNKDRLLHPSEYNSWRGMKRRCYNKEDRKYPSYGGRGIKICDRWLERLTGFSNFFIDMGEKPSPAHSIDRIDNDKGYYPENCRWATAKEQANNRRNPRTNPIKKHSQSGYKGVVWDKNRSKWMVYIMIGGQQKHIGRFCTLEEAIRNRIKAKKVYGV